MAFFLCGNSFYVVLISLWILEAGLLRASDGAREESVPLEQVFQKPPLAARPLGWWHWINGNVTKEGIRADLEDMKRVGMGGAQILDVEIYLPKGPVRYGSDSWHEHVQYAIKTAAELGLELDIANSSGWSGSGGPWITPERAMKKIVWSETTAGGGPVTMDLAKPETKLDFYRDIAVLAVPVTTGRLDKLDAKINWATKPVIRPESASLSGIARDQILNLTDKMNPSGKLTTTLPAGQWVILRFGYTATGSTNHPASPEGKGSEADKLDADTVAFQFEKSLDRIIRDAGPLAGKSFKSILFDSFEAGFQNWTEHLPAEFSKQRGYDLIPFLPVLTGRIIESSEVSEAVLWDFRQVIDEMFAEKYFGTMHQLAAKHGLRIYSESEGGPLNPMSANRHVDVPMNEFWMPDVSARASRMKQTVSAASFLGRPIVAAEAFTAKPEHARFLPTLASLKAPGDHAFTIGINRFCLHSYTHQPVTEAAPGFSLGRYGTHFGRLVTWWPYARSWIEYVSRCSALLQRGKTQADICLLVDEDLGYGLPSKIATAYPGFDFQVAYPSDLRQMSVREGRLVHPEAGSFRILITPQKGTSKSWVAEVATLQRLRDLVKAGAWIAGPPPMAPAGLKDWEQKTEFERLIKEIWGDSTVGPGTRRSIGLGRVDAAQADPAKLLLESGVKRDVDWSPPEAQIRFIHRQEGGVDFYFIQSADKKSQRIQLRLRQTGKIPEIWDPMTGQMAASPIFDVQGSVTTIPMDLEPEGSVFVVFQKPLPSAWISSATNVRMELKTGPLLAATNPVHLRYHDGTEKDVTLPPANPTVEIKGPWQISFPEVRGAPLDLRNSQLFSWPASPEERIQHYAGTAVYRTEFTIPKVGDSEVVILDLGKVDDVAQILINGKDAGIDWHPPFRGVVSSLVREGENEIEIRVANRWINRLIGDEAIPTNLSYQPTGKNKFTDGRLEKIPDWLYQTDARTVETKKRSFAVWKHYEATDPLVPSGLLGPVKLEFFSILPAKSP